MEPLKEQFINQIIQNIHPNDILLDLDIMLSSFYRFEESTFQNEMTIIADDKSKSSKIEELIKKNEQYLNNISVDVVCNEKDNKGIFPLEFYEKLKKIDKDACMNLLGENVLLFVNDEDYLSLVLYLHKLRKAESFYYTIYVIAKTNDQKAFKFLKEKNQAYCCESYLYYKGSIDEVKKKYDITENIFGIVINKNREIIYFLKNMSDFSHMVQFYTKRIAVEKLIDKKKTLAKPENKIEVQNEKVNNIISNLTEIYKLCSKKIEIQNFYYQTFSIYTNNNEYIEIKYNVNVSVLNQRIFKELISLIEPIKEKIPDVNQNDFQLHYFVDYHFLVDMSFQEGKKCVKCKQLITKKSSYYVCFLCKIEKNDYIICKNCFNGVSQHKHPIIYVPIGGNKYLSDLTNLRAIQEEADPNIEAPSISLNCWRCGILMSKIAYYCCMCKNLQFCPKCFLKFKEGEHYKYDDENTLQHLSNHPMLITNDKWFCDYRVWDYENYKENKEIYFSYLYESKNQ